MPTAHEDEAADMLVEGEDCPHADKTETGIDAYYITEGYGNGPLEEYSDNYGIDGVAGGGQCARGEDVADASYLKDGVDGEDIASQGDDLLVLGEVAEHGMS